MRPAATILAFTLALASSQDDMQFDGYYCYVRCVAACLKPAEVTADRLAACQQSCEPYRNDSLCAENDHNCWLRCKDLTEVLGKRPDSPSRFRVDFTESADPLIVSAKWIPVDGVILYVLQFKDASDVFDDWKFNSLEVIETNLQLEKNLRCPEYVFRAAAVTADGVSTFTPVQTLPASSPRLPSRSEGSLKVVSIIYSETPFVIEVFGNQQLLDNASILIELEYEAPPGWSLNDMQVVGNDHIAECKVRHPPINGGIVRTETNRPSVTFILPAAVFDYSCTVILTVDKLKSRLCQTTANYPNRSRPLFLPITCKSVFGAPGCDNPPPEIAGPRCGAVKHSYEVIGESADVRSNLTGNLTVRTQWDGVIAPRADKPILYYAIRFGQAVEMDDPGIPDIHFATVNLTKPLGPLLRTCDLLADPNLKKCSNETKSIYLTNLEYEQLYGVQICAVYDRRKEIPPFDPSTPKYQLITSNRIFLERAEEEVPVPINAVVLAVVIPLAVAVSVVVCVGCFIFFHARTQRKEMEEARMEMTRMEADMDARYTDLPKKHDLWELERRRLIVHEDQKLGSGAFGSVYRGKIVGKAHGHQDSSSSLATNLMRVENCDVAVKMLPEYADQMSKSDFLKEINLMKQLGYHERLVNMLACVTESEPYSLIVEYCSDGDLLHFLRARCKYMMKMDAEGVDYANPQSLIEQLDPNMVLTLKDLLSYSVQISYGLEYLSQKGYVHRDVAARNVLVHDKSSVKIGDFGLCRFVYSDSSAYWGKGGRLPVKWMPLESIRSYEFTPKSDVWSFGVLLFEIITLGGSPYPGIQPADIQAHLEAGKRMDQPDNCPDNVYSVMLDAWRLDAQSRPDFGDIRQRLAGMLEQVTEEYSYLKLDRQRDYYNVAYPDADDEPAGPAESSNVGLDNCGFDAIPEDSLPEEVELVGAKDKPALVGSHRDSGFDNTSEDSLGHSPRAPRHTLESTSSELFLVTPLETAAKKKRFALPEVAPVLQPDKDPFDSVDSCSSVIVRV